LAKIKKKIGEPLGEPAKNRVFKGKITKKIKIFRRTMGGVVYNNFPARIFEFL
jgi:hypothetical protein